MGFIGGLFAGLFGIFGNLFSKKEEFFLDLNDAKDGEKTLTAPAKAEEKVAPATTPTEKKVPKKEAVAKAKKVEKATPTPAPVAKTKPAAKTTPVTPVNVIANTAPRRRPGPSLNQFKDMARQMNVRR